MLKDHPFVIALNALCPVLLPSFYLRSARDKEEVPAQYPLVDYIIVQGLSKSYDNSKKKFRSNFLVKLDFFVRETETPNDWCKYTELKDAQSVQALHWFFENRIEDFIELLTNPRGASNLLNESDMIYSEFDFRLENFVSIIYHRKWGQDHLTGTSANFVLSAWSTSNQNQCCLIDESDPDQLEKLKKIVKEGSVSYLKIENILNP